MVRCRELVTISAVARRCRPLAAQRRRNGVESERTFITGASNSRTKTCADGEPGRRPPCPPRVRRFFHKHGLPWRHRRMCSRSGRNRRNEMSSGGGSALSAHCVQSSTETSISTTEPKRDSTGVRMPVTPARSERRVGCRHERHAVRQRVPVDPASQEQLHVAGLEQPVMLVPGHRENQTVGLVALMACARSPNGRKVALSPSLPGHGRPFASVGSDTTG